MKTPSMLEKFTQMLSCLKLKDARNPRLARMDRGILEVALLIAALDGEVKNEELAAFEDMLRKTRGYSKTAAMELRTKIFSCAGFFVLAAKSPCYTEEERLDIFIKTADACMPLGFADGAAEDIRRAFAIWTVMAYADGKYSPIERRAIECLLRHFSEVRAVLQQNAALAWAAVQPLSPFEADATIDILSKRQREALLEDYFLDMVEGLAKKMSKPKFRDAAEKELAAFIVTNPKQDK